MSLGSFRKPANHRLGLLWRNAVPLLLISAFFSSSRINARAVEARGEQFIAFTRFPGFQKSNSEAAHDTVLTSPEILTRIQWDQLVASWNIDLSSNSVLKVEVRALYPDRATRFYTLGLWAGGSAPLHSQSIPGQKDSDAEVATDTLILKRPAQGLQLKLTFGPSAPKLRFFGLSLLDSKTSPPPLPPNTTAWSSLLPVPERSQMDYTNGSVLCSPTTVSMLLSYWAQKLKRPDLDRDVPEVISGVYDANWEGTGNWSFNTAYAGSARGLRSYVARLSDVSEIEDWIAASIPVGLSVCYNRLRGKDGPYSGHLVVCIGFTQDGDPIINDPGTHLNVRKIFTRKNLIDAWAYSHNTVYLVYPQNTKAPKDRFGHWDSRATRYQPGVRE